MLYLESAIVKDVRKCMEENTSDESLIEASDIDSLEFDEVIKSKILEAVERVHCQAPYYLLETGTDGVCTPFCTTSADLVWGNKAWGSEKFKYAGYVKLPDDFMRLVAFQLSDWERPCYTVITPADPEYKRQRSRIAALRGTPQRPVVALCEFQTGTAESIESMRVLEYYSCSSQDATPLMAQYVAYPEFNSDNKVNISHRCYTAAVYTAAALTLISCGESDKGQTLLEMAKTYLEK